MSKRQMEYKQLPFYVQKYDDDQGIVDAIVAVMGALDHQGDIIENNSFVKTITERGHKVKVLDNHSAGSVRDVVGKVNFMREVGRNELPAPLLEQYPNATGGLFASIQFLIDTPEGSGIFKRIKVGAADSYSIGYDALDYAYENMEVDGDKVNVRRLKTIRLWEISPVVFAAQEATMTVSAKSQPSEAKPWDTFPVGGEYCVFRVDADGNRVGEALGCHDTEEAARQQVEALYAAEPEAGGKAGLDAREGDAKEPETASNEGSGDEEKAITDEDKNVLRRELRALNMRDLVATHRRLHQMAAQGNTLTGFSRADMNWLHAAAEAELRRRAEEDDRETPEASPLEWGKAEGGEPETPDDEDEKHMPGRVGVIAARTRRKAAEDDGEGDGMTIFRHVDTGELKFCWRDDEGKHHKITESEIRDIKEGRVLSTANANRIKTAVTALLDALGSAGIDIMEERGKAGPPPGEASISNETGPEDTPSISSETGPQDEAAPAGEMLKLIEAERERISIAMEV